MSDDSKLFTIARPTGDFSQIGALAHRVARSLEHQQQTPEGREEARRRTRLYRDRQRRELFALANERCIPLDAAIRDRIADRDLDWPGVNVLRALLLDRAQRQGNRRNGRTPGFSVLCGPKGTGKTTALAWLVTHAPLTAQYATAAEIASTKRWGDGAALWARWERVDILAIDELGVEEDASVISTLLLHRWDRTGGLTVCAGNLTEADVARRYFESGVGDRLLDRLVLQRAEWAHEIEGPSRTERALGAR